MNTQEQVIVERPSSDIVVLKINRPQVRNALNLDVRTRLADEVARCSVDETVRCIVITGSDTVFAAGADIGEMADAGPVEVMSRNVQKYWRVLTECPKPLLAAVEGFALGGGLELALCADIIIAGEGAKLGLPEVKVGILPGGGGTQKLARLIGRQRAMLLIMTGRMFGAAEALSMGVVSDVAPAGRALARNCRHAANFDHADQGNCECGTECAARDSVDAGAQGIPVAICDARPKGRHASVPGKKKTKVRRKVTRDG
jgi:enoyl-CoA hydratase/carnithine racemase